MSLHQALADAYSESAALRRDLASLTAERNQLAAHARDAINAELAKIRAEGERDLAELRSQLATYAQFVRRLAIAHPNVARGQRLEDDDDRR